MLLINITIHEITNYEKEKRTNCPPEECPTSEKVPLEPPQPHVKTLPPETQ